MKKALTPVLAVVAVVAIIFSCVFGSQKGNLQKTLDSVQAELTQAKADATAKAADVEAKTAEVESLKAELESKLAEAAEAAKADTEAQVAAAKEAAQKDLDAAKAEAETVKKDLETAAAGAAEAAKTEIETQVTAAKEAAQKEIDAAKAELEAAKESAATALAAVETAKTEAAAAKEASDKALAEAKEAADKALTEAKEAAQKEIDTAKAELETAKTEAAAAKEALEADIADLKAKLEKAERALIAAKSNAYIMYANGDWSVQNWGTADSEDAAVKVTPAAVTGAGEYTVGLEFAQPAEGLAFTALGLQRGETDFPGGTMDITAIRVNGEPIEIKKGYTSSDDGKETRMNIYNEWVSELPADARRADQDLTDAAPVIVDKEAFASVSSVEVDFTFQPLTAYLMYADAGWAYQNWGTADSDTVKVTTAAITGEGEYTVGLEFAEPAEGLAFTAIGIKNGEATFPGYIIKATKVTINDGEENLLNGVGYTNADDGKETRENLYNEWVDVNALPADARNEEGLEGASPMIVDKDAFTGVSKVMVTFRYIKGQAPAAAAADEGMTEDEAKALKEAGFHAYIGVQSDTYIFRNAWDESSYGLNAENDYFSRLTGWDGGEKAEDGSVNYGGTFADAEINGDGEYTVSLTTGEMGFGTDASFRMLFVSTDIPSKLVEGGYLNISDVRIKIGDGATQEYTQVDTDGDYVRITGLDSYNQTAEPFGYTVPGADATISFTFTVSGW